MMETTTSLSDQTKLDCVIVNLSDDGTQDDESFYNDIRFCLDQQLIEPSFGAIRNILKYSNEAK